MSFTYLLENEDGSPAEPAILKTAVPNWGPGDTIPLGGGAMLRVMAMREPDDPDGEPVLIVATE